VRAEGIDEARQCTTLTVALKRWRSGMPKLISDRRFSARNPRSTVRRIDHDVRLKGIANVNIAVMNVEMSAP
jgi:hypothetical protein